MLDLTRRRILAAFALTLAALGIRRAAASPPPVVTQETALDHLRSFMAVHFSGRPLRVVKEGDQVQSIDDSRLLKVRGPIVTDNGGHFLVLAQMVSHGRLFGVKIVIGRDGAVAMIDDYPTDPSSIHRRRRTCLGRGGRPSLDQELVAAVALGFCSC